MLLVAPAVVLMEERRQALTMVVAPAVVLMKGRGKALTMVVTSAAVLMVERGLVLKMVVSPAKALMMEERELALTMVVKSAPYPNPGTALILVVVRKALCMRDIAGLHDCDLFVLSCCLYLNINIWACRLFLLMYSLCHLVMQPITPRR